MQKRQTLLEGCESMKLFVPREKMSKKAQKELAAERRGTWAFSPVTRKIDSKTIYNCKGSPGPEVMTAGRFFFVDWQTCAITSEIACLTYPAAFV